MSALPRQLASATPSSSKLPPPSLPWTPDAAPIDLYLASQAHDAAKGRQTKFVESLQQRRQRVEFLRRREWTRRIAEWIDSAAGPEAKALAPITYSWVDILAAADADDDYEDPLAPAPYPSFPCAPAYTPAAPDAEPYIIYTASPRSSTSPARPPALNTAPPPVLRRTHAEPRSRHSSLSSISEEEEPAPAPCF
ncbi:uncharacterized protein C8Q71DRAFT_754142 [Rhodofomes roseus]|uniref:Uncharacterized protein n=1 Tax=Rhodofomes roseus TaxID=34475 RepID=A0ABQ8KID8_9APHY|nr:uncharacterized protein C8Q71DRAFT_754142 [Rhodofomes roseus]KAH9837723.1 hypothetical protein C8Q71DRAFT_754142 [Rhodofomes roseus]